MARARRKNQSLLQRIAGGGPNQRGRGRRSNRPRGEGRGFVDTIRSLVSRGK
jgi:hypothetical protein